MNLLKIEFDKDRVYGLDILRTLAITFVVYVHSIHIFSDDLTRWVMKLPVLSGVSIFFVLSGFLIGGVLIKIIESRDITIHVLINFWKRRWFRTLPNYFLILSILFMVLGNNDTLNLAKYSLFIQNFNTPHPSFFPEAWSLSVEEWFYLLIPAGVFLAVKVGLKPKELVLLLIIWVIVMSLFIRYYKFYSIEVETVTIHEWRIYFRKQVITRLDGIMFGVLGAYLNHYYNEIWLRYKKRLLLIGIALLILHKLTLLARIQFNLESNSYYCIYSFSVASLGVLLLLPFLSTYRKFDGKLYRVVTIISLISYSMYLINLSLVQSYFIPLLMKSVPIPLTGIPLEIYTYIIYWLITIVGSILIYKYYEVPFTKLRDTSFFSRNIKRYQPP